MEIQRRNGKWSVRTRYKGKYLRVTKKDWLCKDFTKSEIELLAYPILERKIKELDGIIEKEIKYKHSLQGLYEGFIQNEALAIKPASLENEKVTFVKYVLPYFGADNCASDVITPKTITQFRLYLAQLPELQDCTVNLHLGRLKKFIDYLVVMDELNGDVGYKSRTIIKAVRTNKERKTPKVERNYLEPQEFEKFIATFEENDIYRYFFLVTYWCGLRIGEALGLKFKDFNYQKCTLTISRQVTLHNNTADTKTEESKATIIVPTEIIKEVESFKDKLIADNNDFVFLPKKRMCRATIRKVLIAHLEQAQLHRITIHGLRHSYASLLANSKEMFTGLTIQHQLRHASYETTSKTYEHWFDKDSDRINIDKLCNPTNKKNDMGD